MSEAKPVRLQLSRRKGFSLQKLSKATNGLEAVVVRRPTKWGNPFTVDQYTSRADAVRLYRQMVETGAFRRQFLHELRGKNLACTCPLPKPGEPDHCHAAVLLELSNPPEGT